MVRISKVRAKSLREGDQIVVTVSRVMGDAGSQAQ